jgi:hypothetical protein
LQRLRLPKIEFREIFEVDRCSLFCNKIDPQRTSNRTSNFPKYVSKGMLLEPRRRTMRRRKFITLIGGAAAWPLAAPAQQAVVPLIGVLMNRAADDPEGQARLASFQKGLQDAGWEVGRNLRIEIRWGADDVELNANMPPN